MFVFSSSHSITGSLVYRHLMEVVGTVGNPAVLNAAATVYQLLYDAGATVGSLLTGVPAAGRCASDAGAGSGAAGVTLLYAVLQMLLRKHLSAQKQHVIGC